MLRMIKKFMEYDIDTLTCIKACASYAHEVKLLKYQLHHKEHLYKGVEWLEKHVADKYDEMVLLPKRDYAVAWVLKNCGLYEIIEEMEKLMREHNIPIPQHDVEL